MASTARAALGFQDALRITSAPTGAGALVGQPLTGQHLTVAGTYTCDIATAGLAKVEAHVACSVAPTGTVTPSLVALYADGGTKQTAAGVAFSGTVQQDLTLTLDPGVQACRVSIVVAAGASCTIGRAEANGK